MRVERFELQLWLVGLIAICVGGLLLTAAYHLTPPQALIEVAGQKLVVQTTPDPLSKFLLKEFEFALIVGGLLAMTFEYLTKSKHEEAADRLAARMNEKLFHTVLGRDIPPLVYEHVKKSALHADLVRRDFRVFFTLGTAGKDPANPNPDKYVRLSEETQYKVRNISNSRKKFRLGMYLDPVIFPPEDGVPAPEFRFVKIDGKDVKFEKGKVLTSSAEVNAFCEVELSPGEEMKVDSSSYCYMRLTDEQVFTVRHPTEGMAITLISHLPHLGLDCYSLHGSDLIVIRNEDTSKEWALEEALLAGQGVIVKWSEVASSLKIEKENS